jgi:hypothetical protein
MERLGRIEKLPGQVSDLPFQFFAVRKINVQSRVTEIDALILILKSF